MSWKIKSAGLLFAALCAAGFLFLGRHGEYDSRNLPGGIRISAKAMDGYHVHAKVSFYPSREIPGLCVRLLGTASSSTISETYNDIPGSGVEAVTKKKWAGLCKYQLNRIFVTCAKTKTFPDFKNDSVGEAAIGILEANRPPQTAGGYVYPSASANRIEGRALNIRIIKGENIFFGCDSNCEDHGDFGIDKTDTALAITCKED